MRSFIFIKVFFMRPILEIAAALDLQPNSLICYGEHMAKLRLGVLPKKEAKELLTNKCNKLKNSIVSS